MAHEVFISYSHQDKEVADAVCAKLEQNALRCWIAPRNVVPGEEWGMSIVNAIRDSRVLVLIFSSSANNSPQIRRELERAVNNGITIVPFRIENVAPNNSLVYFIGLVHWMDAWTPPLQDHLNNLAETLKAVLERPSIAPEGKAQAAVHPVNRSRHLLVGLLWTLVAIASAFGIWRYRNESLKVPRIAVIGPINNSGNQKFGYLTTQIGDIVSINLAQAYKLNAIPRDDVLEALGDISVPALPCSAKTHTVQIAQVLGASYFIFGSFHQNSSTSRSNIHIDLCLLDPDGNILATFGQDTDESSGEIFSAQAADHFRHFIANGRLAPQDFRRIYPQDPDASRLYFEGIGKMRTFNAAEALDKFQEASRKERSSPLIHSALAQAWSMLRHDQEAADEANSAVAYLPRSFPLEFDTIIRASAAEMNKKWETAIPLYTSLYNSNPERLDLGLKLAAVQTVGSAARDALLTLDELSALPAPLGQDPRILIERAGAFLALADYPSSIKAAERALKKAKDKESPSMQANAELQLCRAYQKIGDIDKARSSCDQAQQQFRAFRDYVSAAVALNGIATWLTDRQRYAEAKQNYNEIVFIHEKAQDQKDLAGALINRARLATYEDKPSEAEPDLRRALDIARHIQDRYDQALALIILAEISRGKGDIRGSIGQAREARELASAIPDRDVEASALSALALAQTESGEILQALENCTIVLKMRQDPSEIATTRMRMGDIYLRLAKFSNAREQYEDAREIYHQLQKPTDEAHALLELAEVDLNVSKLLDAEKKAKNALAIFQEKNDVDSQADSLATLLRALVGQGESRFAEAANRRTVLKSINVTDDEVRFDVALAEGSILIAERSFEEALGILNTASADAAGLGQQFTALQLQLLSVKASAELGDRGKAKKTLAAIRSSSQRLRFKLIIDNASVLAHSLQL